MVPVEGIAARVATEAPAKDQTDLQVGDPGRLPPGRGGTLLWWSVVGAVVVFWVLMRSGWPGDSPRLLRTIPPLRRRCPWCRVPLNSKSNSHRRSLRSSRCAHLICDRGHRSNRSDRAHLYLCICVCVAETIGQWVSALSATKVVHGLPAQGRGCRGASCFSPVSWWCADVCFSVCRRRWYPSPSPIPRNRNRTCVG